MGSHLCDALLGQGHSVLAVDNLITGRLENIPQGPGGRFEFRQHDVSQPFDFGPVDYVFHFASPAGPADYTQFGIATLRTGSFGTLNALDVARRYKAKFLLASASEVYGDPEIHPQPEDYWGRSNPIGQRSTYTEAKRLSEVATMAYRRYFGLDTRIARLFYIYGPRMRVDDGRMVANFMMQALRGEELTVQGDGSQTRSPTYVSDAVNGILGLAWSNEHSPVNLGWPGEIAVLECAKQVLAVTGSKSKIAFQPLPEDDAKRRCPDITKARALLSWEPKVDLRSGLEHSVDYFRAAVHKSLAAQAAVNNQER